MITGLILTLFFCAPVVTNAMYEAARLTPKHGGRLSKSRGNGHIVVSQTTTEYRCIHSSAQRAPESAKRRAS